MVLIPTKDTLDKAEKDLSNPAVSWLMQTAVKMPALPNVERLKKNDFFFILEALAAGAAAASVTIEDGKVNVEDMAALQAIYRALSGRELTAEQIYCFLSLDKVSKEMLPQDMQDNLQALISFIKGILMSMPAQPITQDLRTKILSRRLLEYSL